VRGSEFLALHGSSTQAAFEAAVLENKASWITWPVVEVPLAVPGHTASIFVNADYFAIGEGADVLYCPLSASAAQTVADACNAILPTSKIVDLIWAAATAKTKPITGGELGIEIGTPDQLSVRAFGVHSAAIRKQLGLFFGSSETLVAGSKKDVVLSNRLEVVDAAGHGGPNKVCIYGWHKLNGVPIQPLSTRHDYSYRDYSHGVRLVFETMLFDGATMPVADMFSSGRASMLSYEGVMRVLRQPEPRSIVSTLRPPSSSEGTKTLRLGSRGHDVGVWQQIVGVAPPTEHFGPLTLAATKAWQLSHGLVADGIVGPASWGASRMKGSSPAETLTGPDDVPSKQGFAGTPIVQARHCLHLPPGRQLLWIVLHTMEIEEKGSSAKACARYFATTERAVSSHFCVDAHAVFQCVSLDDVAFCAPGANRSGIHIEHAGFARQTTDEWQDDYSMAMLTRSAALVSQLLEHADMPCQYVDAAGLLEGRAGITTHYQCTLAGQSATKQGLTASPFHGKGTGGHIDPGPRFPMDMYLALVADQRFD
jgi:peptidoglycan hydrolase-like protein with peptidoglycan-binding domain